MFNFRLGFKVYFFFLLSFFLISCASRQANLKNQQTQENTWDFGRVTQGRVLEHVFILSNLKDRPLSIKSINTSCGCTVSETQKKLLLSGEQTQINVKFHTQGYSGTIKQQVYVNTDDIYEPVIKFTITAQVIK